MYPSGTVPTVLGEGGEKRGGAKRVQSGRVWPSTAKTPQILVGDWGLGYSWPYLGYLGYIWVLGGMWALVGLVGPPPLVGGSLSLGTPVLPVVASAGNVLSGC